MVLEIKKYNGSVYVINIFTFLFLLGYSPAMISGNDDLKELERNAEITKPQKPSKARPELYKPSDYSHWRVGNFVDSFGDTTNEKYVITSTDGKFSNSATMNSYLHVEVLITEYRHSMVFFLKEYNKDRPNVYFFNEYMILQAKNTNGKVFKLSTACNKWNSSGGVRIVFADKFINFLKKSKGIVKCYLTDNISSEYYFSINANGITKALKSINL